MNNISAPVPAPSSKRPFIREEAFPFGYPCLWQADIQIGFFFKTGAILGTTILENGTTYRDPDTSHLYQMVSLFLRNEDGEEVETHIVMLLCEE
jgi:hypothetical protein